MEKAGNWKDGGAPKHCPRAEAGSQALQVVGEEVSTDKQTVGSCSREMSLLAGGEQI